MNIINQPEIHRVREELRRVRRWLKLGGAADERDQGDAAEHGDEHAEVPRYERHPHVVQRAIERTPARVRVQHARRVRRGLATQRRCGAGHGVVERGEGHDLRRRRAIELPSIVVQRGRADEERAAVLRPSAVFEVSCAAHRGAVERLCTWRHTRTRAVCLALAVRRCRTHPLTTTALVDDDQRGREGDDDGHKVGDNDGAHEHAERAERGQRRDEVCKKRARGGQARDEHGPARAFECKLHARGARQRGPLQRDDAERVGEDADVVGADAEEERDREEVEGGHPKDGRQREVLLLVKASKDPARLLGPLAPGLGADVVEVLPGAHDEQ